MILWAFLLSLGLVTLAAAYVVARGVALWRQTKRTGKTLTAELATFEERAARTERLLAEADAASARLAEAQERLRISRARLKVLTYALERTQRRTQWLRDFVPYV